VVQTKKQKSILFFNDSISTVKSPNPQKVGGQGGQGGQLVGVRTYGTTCTLQEQDKTGPGRAENKQTWLGQDEAKARPARPRSNQECDMKGQSKVAEADFKSKTTWTDHKGVTHQVSPEKRQILSQDDMQQGNSEQQHGSSAQQDFAEQLQQGIDETRGQVERQIVPALKMAKAKTGSGQAQKSDLAFKLAGSKYAQEKITTIAVFRVELRAKQASARRTLGLHKSIQENTTTRPRRATLERCVLQESAATREQMQEQEVPDSMKAEDASSNEEAPISKYEYKPMSEEIEACDVVAGGWISRYQARNINDDWFYAGEEVLSSARWVKTLFSRSIV